MFFTNAIAHAAGNLKNRAVDNADIVLAAFGIARDGDLVHLRIVGHFRLDENLLIRLRMVLPHAHDDGLAVGAALAPGPHTNGVATLDRNFVPRARILHHAKRSGGTLHQQNVILAALCARSRADVIDGPVAGDVFHFQPHLFRRKRWRTIDDGSVGNSLSDLEILVEQGRIQHQRGRNLVETFGRAIGWKELQGTIAGQKCDVEQITNGVCVFRSIHPPHYHASASPMLSALSVAKFRGNPAGDGRQLFNFRPRLAIGRHLTEVQIVHYLNPFARHLGSVEVGRQIV